MKKKIAAIVLAGTLVGGAGANAAFDITGYVKEKINTVVGGYVSAISLDGYAESKETGIKAAVNNKTVAVIQFLQKHYNDEIQRGKNEIDSYANKQVKDTDAAGDEVQNDVKTKITQKVNSEVSQAKTHLDETLKDELDKHLK